MMCTVQRGYIHIIVPVCSSQCAPQIQLDFYSCCTIPLTVPRCRYVPFAPLHIVAEVCPAHIIHQDKDYVGALLALLALTSPKQEGEEEEKEPGHLSSWLGRYWQAWEILASLGDTGQVG